jgi:peroxiredoxin
LIPVGIIIGIVAGGLYVVKSTLVKQGANPGASAGGSDSAVAASADGATFRVATGETLPDVKIQQFKGPELALSQLPNKVTLINFWATWCEACVVEMPSIVAVQHALKDKGFGVAAVSLDDNPDQVLPGALPKLKIDFPVFSDPDSKVAGMFEVRAIPLTVIINHERKILHIEDGERDWNAQDIRAKIEAWLSP